MTYLIKKLALQLAIVHKYKYKEIWKTTGISKDNEAHLFSSLMYRVCCTEEGYWWPPHLLNQFHLSVHPSHLLSCCFWLLNIVSSTFLKGNTYHPAKLQDWGTHMWEELVGLSEGWCWRLAHPSADSMVEVEDNVPRVPGIADIARRPDIHHVQFRLIVAHRTKL